MRNLFKIIKEHFILLLGTGLFNYSLFNFSSKYHAGIDIPLDTWVREISQGVLEIRTYPIATYYYYEPEKIILITLGAILIVIGLLKIRNKYIDRVEKNDKN
jgi:uncharacterized membrane protein HdeD (DUF308 family)